MSREYEQIPESFIRDLGADRRELVEALKKNDTNLDGLVDHLYPDTAHLVFELLQNAEDKGAASARFELSELKLSFTHDGRPFSKEDIKRITNYGRSAEYEEKDTIGRFGIGFKSVFGCTETPRIYSDTVAFEIVDRIVPGAIPPPASSIGLSDRETVIELPFSSELTINSKMKTRDEVREEIRLGLAGMSVMSVLHLQNIESIEWRTDNGDSGSLIRTELGGGVVQVRDKSPSGEERRCFLRFREPYCEGSSMYLDVVFELEEKERDQGALQVVGEALADRFRIVPAERGSVAVFFPATKETSNLRFHVHAPFIPELSRASVKEHPENDALIARLAALVAKSLPAIRRLGLLDRDFLGVLPNSQDPLAAPYKPFHAAVVQAMREESLVPMQGGGHGRAAHLLQGPADLKVFLGVDDIHFLMSGWDSEAPQYSWQFPAQKTRSTVSPSEYRGWAVSATQKSSAVDRFLIDLTIGAFEVKYLAPPASKTNEEIEEWLATHDVRWHRAYYASVEKYWDANHSAYDRLRRLPIVRTQSGKYRRAAECRFAIDGDDAPEGVAIADPDTYSGGKGTKDAKKGLERLGVCEIDDESRAIGILDKYYGESGHRPTEDEHRNHVETFIGLVRKERVTVDKFGEYSLLLDCDEDWLPPSQLYAGKRCPDASAAPYFRHLECLTDYLQPVAQALRYELHRRYWDMPGFSEFARQIGVAYSIPISETACRLNPDWQHLQSGGGVNVTSYGIDRDWQIPNLDDMLQRLKQANHPEAEREKMAKAIRAALDQTKEDTWPPPEPCFSELPISGKLVAVYRRNASAGYRAAPSQLVFTLRNHAWVPQKQGRDSLIFVTPSKARPDRLPEGFAFDFGWAWVKAIRFASESGEAEPSGVLQKHDREVREAKAKDLGFENLDAAEAGKWFAELSEGEKEEIRQRHESEHRPPPEFPDPPNPERRRERARKLAKDAPRRKTEHRERSIVQGEPKLKEEARTKLRAKYEEHARVSLCQVIGCQDRSFKLKEGAWYFEAVRFLGLDKMVADDYVAFCPRHAAMYQHAKESDGLKQEFEQRCAVGNYGKGMLIPVVLAGEHIDVLLAPEHVIDLEVALEVDAEQDTEGD
ncbi:sacsin N-terminal ATP-binding-like domain-containing protein [Candidatus Palauibacter sp.]|uniref:sacsin N-terminal ATP-binding-like domain-containing protein n=1 Tax=Candidatus Palauibacter sp. TaxID=3101350 RepID=UPI003C6FA071